MSKTVNGECAQQGQPADEPSALQIVQMHAGWDAARRGLPLDMKQGRWWVEGWINYGWMRGGPGRSWLRH